MAYWPMPRAWLMFLGRIKNESMIFREGKLVDYDALQSLTLLLACEPCVGEGVELLGTLYCGHDLQFVAPLLTRPAPADQEHAQHIAPRAKHDRRIAIN